MFYLIDTWKDANVNKLCSNQISIQEFFEKCSPQMENYERQELFYQYFHDYFHDHKARIDPKWVHNQLMRPDAEERMIAFYESIYDAIVTDGEDWDTKGHDVMVALLENNATALMVALCGWGPINLAKRALMMRGRCDITDGDVQGNLKVDWSDGERTSVPCVICSKDHQIVGFDYSVFSREDTPTATIQNVFVRFKPFENGNEYDFQCASKAERDTAGDDDVFWYVPNENTGSDN